MNEDEKLVKLFQKDFEAMMDMSPSAATMIGFKHEKYDHLMPKRSSEANEENIIYMLNTKRDLKSAIDYELLSEEGKLDYALINYMFDLRLFAANELATWRSGYSSLFPGAGGPIGTIGAALFPLYTRDYAPLETRVKAMINRLKATPRFLEETKSNWQFPVRLWTEMAIEEGLRTTGFLFLIQNTLEPTLEPTQHQELVEAVNVASEAIEKYTDWIKNEILPKATYDWKIGSNKFSRLIAIRKLGKKPEEILKIGEKALKDTKVKLEELGHEIYPDKTIQEIRELLKNEHPPTFEMVLEHVRELTQDAREFIREKELMNIPEGEDLQVLPTPSFLIPIIPFAAYIQPEIFSKHQVGQYIVTPIEGREEMLQEHSYASCKNTAVHEGYPGHHLQLTSANLQPNLIRTIIDGDETVEGWAHYCEQLMAEHGFLGKKEVFLQLVDQLWRAVRIIVDIKIHTGQMTFDEAKDFMIDQIGMDEQAVMAELKRYTLTPGYQLSYLLGKFMMLELRDYVKEKMEGNYSDQFFHNTILNGGGLPIQFLRKIFDLQISEHESD